jgi:hypothetical protein
MAETGWIVQTILSFILPLGHHASGLLQALSNDFLRLFLGHRQLLAAGLGHRLGLDEQALHLFIIRLGRQLVGCPHVCLRPGQQRLFWRLAFGG